MKSLLYSTLSALVFSTIALLFLSCEEHREEKFVIGFSQCVANDAWRDAMHEEMFRELSFYPNLSLEIKDANGNSDLQIAQIREFEKQGVDLLIVSPNESEPITPIVEEIFRSGIPVIVVDRKINSNQYSAYIGGNNYEIGYTVGQYVRNIFDKEVKILEIWGLRGSSPARDRHQGLIDALGSSAYVLVDQLEGEWEKSIAKERLRTYLSDQTNHGFDMIFAHNDVMAISAREVCDELGIRGKKVIGIDALPGPYAGLQAVTDGVLNATFFYPTGGDKAIEVAWKILQRESFQKENLLQTAAVDSSNVRIMKQQTDRIINQQANISRQSEMIANQIEIYQSQKGLLIVFGITLFIAIVSLAYVFKSLKDKQEINKELQNKNDEVLEQQQKIMDYSKQAEEATQQKLEFFTNISHEFRTPLTLIQGPIEEMLQNKDASMFKSDLFLIRKNTYRLLRLVNQLMDFRKIDGDKMAINASQQALIPFLEDIMSVFGKTAKDNQIRFKLMCEEPHIKLWFDPAMMDKVIFNLLSNSFKFTPRKGFVYVKVSRDMPRYEVVIEVVDNGEGMNHEEVLHVFDRFYQGSSGVRKVGTGLGLALAKELVELQHGKIVAKSFKGENTVFEIRLKMGNGHFNSGELSEGSPLGQVLDHESYISEYDDLQEEERQPDLAQTILIVEDDPEIRNYLKKRLSGEYRVLEAEDCRSALSIALDVVPDLITCDLMLKNEDGLDLIKKLKADPKTSPIPIIVISAKTSHEDQLKGVKTGIDDYITKPFNMAFVKERIKTILSNRSKIKAHYLHELPASDPTAQVDRSERKFVNVFTSLIEQNIGDPNFGVNEIGKEMGLSRGQLYRKVKSTLGYSVNDYIVKIRLKKAKYLLINDTCGIAEVAFKTGFKTSAYFSTVFKNAFDYTPSEFRESQGHK
ncbi:signal transduction histidine kinase/CheY-like chemotaxis protein/AraC-like DNA-binding protein [Algoriphagus sp. 4150]|uniref:hybrid sensor histidine kinase/response regulator transcription factor n=1 Tax=Algoriphagus sp. 4150 TaxID=2817756 RepID=UPI00285C7444|nr:substrate-binding domain-containing protein [Algoriphagus sp. 4150]MDR7128577.1 signal transduction histidine kinase/CheY-like chemotaxis protein/AraC-like DNA-binding protein [Algoriphagus sp. 4150]